MKMKDFIKEISYLLEMDEIYNTDIDNLQNNSPSAIRLVENLARCINMTITEIASYYVPIVKQKEYKKTGGKTLYGGINQYIKEIVKVVDNKGQELKYEISSKYLMVDSDDFVVHFTIIPRPYKLEEEIDYVETQFPKTIIFQGAISEFLLAQGDFEQAILWRERYIESLKKLKKPTNKNTARRKWA